MRRRRTSTSKNINILRPNCFLERLQQFVSTAVKEELPEAYQFFNLLIWWVKNKSCLNLSFLELASLTGTAFCAVYSYHVTIYVLGRALCLFSQRLRALQMLWMWILYLLDSFSSLKFSCSEIYLFLSNFFPKSNFSHVFPSQSKTTVFGNSSTIWNLLLHGGS